MIKRLSPPDPVFQHEDGSWWFADEVWADEYGPYETEEQAREQLLAYCEANGL